MVVGLFVVSVCINEIVLWQFKDDSDEDEELADNFLPAVAVESGDFALVFAGNPVEWFIGVDGDCFWDVELRVVRLRV
jgi:hypothetical protein